MKSQVESIVGELEQLSNDELLEIESKLEELMGKRLVHLIKYMRKSQ